MKTLHRHASELHSDLVKRQLFWQGRVDGMDRRDRQTQEGKDAQVLSEMYGDLIDVLLPYLDK